MKERFIYAFNIGCTFHDVSSLVLSALPKIKFKPLLPLTWTIAPAS